MEGAEAVLGDLSMTVLPLVLLLTVLLAEVLLTVFEDELTVLDDELTVLEAVVLVTVSVAWAAATDKTKLAAAAAQRDFI